jgi:microcystin-dependent protein
VKDTTAPAVPTGLVAANGILGIGLAWTSNTEADFDHYDVLVDDDVAFGSAASFVCRASLLSVVPLTAGTYYVKIRAVDTSGNASAYCTAQSAAARLTGTSDLDPTAIINQATNVLNGPATIKVDSTGLTIENGALILKDEFGTTVMVASGFAGTWSDFFATGLYNGLLLSGTVGTVTNGRSSKLPYWTAADTAGTPTLSFLSGGGVKTTFAAFGTGKSIVSDVVKRTQDEDIEFGVTYDIGRTTAGSLRLTVAVENNSAADFSGFSSAGTHDSNVLTTAVSDSGKLRIATSPVGGPYFRLRITMEEITAHNAANYITVNKAWMLGRGQSGGQLTLTDSLIAPGLQVIDGTSPTVQLTHGLLVTSGLGDDIAQDGVVSSFVPIGCVLPFAGAAAPTGWLLCQGQSVLRATYPNLFSAIGTTFGAADGTHFTLPDMRNRFPIGAGTSAALAATGGSFSHTHTSTAHSHSHSHTEAAHTHPLSDAGQAKITIASSATLDAVATPTWTSTRRYTNTLTSVGNTTWTEGPGLAGATDSTSPGATGTDATSTTPGATGSNNPPYIGLNFIIKAE